MPVESLDTSQQLAVRANGDEHLRVRSDGSLEDGEGAGGEFVLFQDRNLIFPIRTKLSVESRDVSLYRK